MQALFAFVLLIGATMTAERLDRTHRPVALALWCLLLSGIAALLRLPDVLVYASTVAPPAAIVAAAWAALHTRCRPYFGLLLSSITAVSTFIALAADRFHCFGHVMAYLWVGSAIAGCAALARGEAPAATRAVLIALLAGLPVEAVGWVGWQDGSDGPYFFARTIGSISMGLVIVIQAAEGATRPQWAILHSLRLAWARSSHNTDPHEETTKVDSRR